MSIRPVREDNHGLYIWLTEDGKTVMNEDRDVLNIPSRFGDITRIAILQRAAVQCGVEGGRAKFLPGHRRVSDSELEDQKARLADGLIADPMDFRAFANEYRQAMR